MQKWISFVILLFVEKTNWHKEVKLTPFVKTHSIFVCSGCKLQQIAPTGLQGYISASLPTNSKLQSYCQYTSKTIKEGFPNVLERWKTTYHVKKKTTHLQLECWTFFVACRKEWNCTIDELFFQYNSRVQARSISN